MVLILVHLIKPSNENIDRFPESFRFQISDEEKTELVANCDRFKTTIKFSPSNPYVFTEQGVAMLSAVLTLSLVVRQEADTTKTMTTAVEVERNGIFWIYSEGEDISNRGCE